MKSVYEDNCFKIIFKNLINIFILHGLEFMLSDINLEKYSASDVKFKKKNYNFHHFSSNQKIKKYIFSILQIDFEKNITVKKI